MQGMSRLAPYYLLGLLAYSSFSAGASSGIPSIVSVTGASSFGGGAAVAAGSWVEIYGTNFSSQTATWSNADFNDGVAPTSLAGVTVSIGGLPAFLSYVSPTQINALLPSGLSLGSQPLTVQNANGISAPYAAKVQAIDPQLWAPALFKIGGTQYAGAMLSDFSTYVLPTGAVPGLTSRSAMSGETVILYGIGFGPVTPNLLAGQIACAGSAPRCRGTPR